MDIREIKYLDDGLWYINRDTGNRYERMFVVKPFKIVTEEGLLSDMRYEKFEIRKTYPTMDNREIVILRDNKGEMVYLPYDLFIVKFMVVEEE